MEEDDFDDVAAAMGFSSFGSSKKRKYEPTATPPRAASASGANSTRMGVRPKTQGGGNQEQDRPDGNSTKVVESAGAAQLSAPNAKGKPKQPPPATGLADFLSRGQALPEKPPTPVEAPLPVEQEDDSASTVSFGGVPITKAELNRLRQGVKNDQGDIAYFLPSFVEDPWAKLQMKQR